MAESRSPVGSVEIEIGDSSSIQLIGIRRLSETDAYTNEAFVQADDEAAQTPSASPHQPRYLSRAPAEKRNSETSGEYEEPLHDTSRWTAGETSGPSSRTSPMKRMAMEEVSLDSFYVPPVSRKYELIDEENEEEEKEETSQKRGRFRVLWRDIVYRINTFSLMNHVVNIVLKTVPESYERTILSHISGSFESGKLTALMGPSGAGKTTLLECLIGKRVRGLSGEINIQSVNEHPLPYLQMALIPQLDSFFEKITPREAIGYASRLKNVPALVSHDEITQELIERLDLSACCDQETSRLSGSERKRLSIACDLVSKPNILVLDEPTTGLDAYAARKLCQLLNELATERNLAVLMTVHQPSWALFLTFHKIYMLSPVIGRAIYEGSPHKLISHLSAFDLHCPKQTNASDFLTEIAFGKAKKQQLEDLAHHHQMQFEHLMLNSTGDSSNLFHHLEKNAKAFPFFSHAYILASRFTLTFTRDLFNLLVSMILSGLLAAIFCITFTFSGESDGCPPDVSRVRNFNNSFYNQLLIDTMIEAKEVRKNTFLVLMIQVVLMMMTLTPVLVLIPQELKIYWKEVKNAYYSPLTLFVAKTIFELVLSLILVTYLECLVYFGTKQRFISDTNGFSGFFGLFEGLYFLALIVQAQGTVVAVLLAQSPDSVIIGGNMLTVMNLLFSSIFAPIQEMSVLAQVVGAFWPSRWIGALFAIGLYGHDRCANYPLERNVNLIKSNVDSWLAYITRTADGDLTSPFVGENLLLGQLMQDQQYALNNLTLSQYREVTKQYVDIHGRHEKYLPMALVNLAIDYDDDVPARLMLITHLILFRVVAYLLLSYATKKSE